MYKAIVWYGVVPVILALGAKWVLDKKGEQEIKSLPNVCVKPVKWKIFAENE